MQVGNVKCNPVKSQGMSQTVNCGQMESLSSGNGTKPQMCVWGGVG